MLLAGLLLAPLLTLASPETQALSTAAASSPRPAACRAGAGESELWARTRGERNRQFCTLLARGYARLQRTPSEALTFARRAAALVPDPVETRVLEGRALLRVGELDQAVQALSASVLAPERPLGDVHALRELAVALARSNRLEEAAQIYRLLVPRLNDTAGRIFARAAVLEAAAVWMATSTSGVGEAALHLSEARRARAIPGLQDLTLALLALALDRAGKVEQAAVALRELAGAWSLEGFLSSAERARLAETLAPDTAHGTESQEHFSELSPAFVEGELHAAIAVAATPSDPKLAALHYAAYLEGAGAKRPWAPWARQRMKALGAAAERR